MGKTTAQFLSLIDKAASQLRLAATYAEDGAIITAIERASAGLLLLDQERRRRVAMGLLPASLQEKKGHRKGKK